ncbi:8876_t:CDS:2 [Paraglomus brasilianum]|uniref:Serine/threonine-protein phosphatase 2A activator n=1 Tax=Paraglomus brasilianum TaxID=144538 RepID=A0A9N8W643_9GLOM|nr:8876_t:CDS:2 [Paraglomus brasilianum]
MSILPTEFRIPRKEILTRDDLAKFHESEAYEEFLNFIVRLNNSVKGLPLSTECHVSQVVQHMLEVLNTVNSYCDEIPPLHNKQSRYGNPAFRDFYDRIAKNADEIHENLLLPQAAIQEVSRYFIESWGNKKRIDYGTGHEANFAVWLLCFEKLGLIGPDDHVALVLKVFQKYIEIMRNLQFKYWLEPAGSHGVWGLDDYHFLPFMFGSAQLTGHKYIRPKSIHDTDIVDEYSKDFMYLACIKFINSVKTESLRWSSPMIDDISGVKTWAKINEGMVKMYKGEVLSKLPIMQHFMFGSLIRFEGSGATLVAADDEEDEYNHIHVHAFGQEFPECCGIRVPSAIGAKIVAGQGVPRRLPFD